MTDLKKILYTLIFIFFGITGYIFFESQITLFSLSEVVSWNVFRYLTVSFVFAALVTTSLVLLCEHQRIKPYFVKLMQFRTLLNQLVRRDFLAKYKRSVLGVLWSVLNPLLTMIVLTIVFSTLFRFEIENYPVYLLSGQIIFTLFSEITNTCMFSILSSASLMKKVNTPKYIFPVSKACSALINFAFSLIALLLVMLLTSSPIHPTLVLAIIPMFYAFIFSMGVGLILASAVVFFRDVSYLYGIFLTALTYFTPLFYPIEIIPDSFRWIISLNPLYHIVECFRTVAIYGNLPSLWQHTVCLFVAASSLAIGLHSFYKSQDKFILYV